MEKRDERQPRPPGLGKQHALLGKIGDPMGRLGIVIRFQ
jgi:hypothetical protein